MTDLPTPMNNQTNPLWTIADIAEYFKVSAAQAARIAVTADFPRPVILPSTGKGERQIKRWLSARVIDWIEEQAKAA